MRLVKLWDATDQEILIDMDRKGKPTQYKEPSKLAEFIMRFIVFLITGKK
jgi:hypothetical protein